LSTNELTCQELVEVVTDYLDGAMAPADRLRFEKHLVMCDGCAVYLEQLRDAIRATGVLREDQVPADARAELLHVFRDWKQSS
jgi:anti-sigma factor RsiW